VSQICNAFPKNNRRGGPPKRFVLRDHRVGRILSWQGNSALAGDDDGAMPGPTVPEQDAC